MANVGWLYEMKRKYDDAMHWYDKAVKHGDPTANWNIVRLYELGCGVKRSIPLARRAERAVFFLPFSWVVGRRTPSEMLGRDLVKLVIGHNL
jgi:hypothetical protein